MDLFCYSLFKFVFANTRCLFVATLWSPVGEELTFGCLECDGVVRFCHFVVLDCIDS